jgi:8-oxo-dGTP diphosphatase
MMIRKLNGQPVFPDRIAELDKPRDSVQVGTGIVITRGTHFLISKRLGPCRLGVGVWALPGGAIEAGESIEECTIREAKEETGLDVIPVKDLLDGSHVWYVYDKVRESSPIITLFTHARLRHPNAEPINPESHKHTPWQWVTLREVERMAISEDIGDWLPIPAFRKYYMRLFHTD